MLFSRCGRCGNGSRDADHDGTGDACDEDGFCLTVPKNPDRTSCLDPTVVFTVVAALHVVANSGEQVFLSVYANLTDVALDYAWRVTEGPIAGEGDIINVAAQTG